MTQVITYQLAYRSGLATLCSACVEGGAHGRGTLGPVSHGEHRGACEGRKHPRKLERRPSNWYSRCGTHACMRLTCADEHEYEPEQNEQ